MRPILYYDERSSPVRSCMLLTKLLKVDVEYKFIDVIKGNHLEAAFLEINPLHTAPVPVLQHNGLTLTDSHAILIYLCENFEGGMKYWPEDKLERIRVINKLCVECSVLFQRDNDMMAALIAHGHPNADLETHEKKITEVYEVLEKNLKAKKSPFICASHMTIADISLLTTLSTVDLLFEVTSEKWPHLFEWFRMMKEELIDLYSECNVTGLEKLQQVVEDIGKYKFPKRG